MAVKLATTSFQAVYDVEKNLAKYKEFIDRAAEQGVNLLVFPEQSLQGYLPTLEGVSEETRAYQLAHAELVPEGPGTQLLAGLAMEKQMYLIWGMTEKDPEKEGVLYNTAVLAGPEGYIGKYRKVHQPGCEGDIYTPGSEFSVFDTAIGKIGLLICYDKAFPESARDLYAQGAEIIVQPAAWPMSGDPADPQEDDMTLGIFNLYDRVRAMENAVFFISCNQCGTCGDINYCGHSRITHPFGMELACTGWGEGMAVAEVDIQEQILAAGGPNTRKDRHPEAYSHIAQM